jgi:sulfite reductase alpha subunit-like flavoprotein
VLTQLQEIAKDYQTGTFSMYTAFSRTLGGEKQYVQHLLNQQAEQVRELILRQGAYVYVCGNARSMAKDVYITMKELLEQDCDSNGDAYVADMKKAKRWQEDVW